MLQMAALGLGDPGEVQDFPFVDPPDRARRPRRPGAAVRARRDLERPGSGPAKLTPIGRQLTRLPIDPPIGPDDPGAAGPLGCIDDVIVIAAALSIQDPRERPSDRQAAADQSHARFADPTSDFLGMLHLWRYVTEQQQERSSSKQFRRMCTAGVPALPAGTRMAGSSHVSCVRQLVSSSCRSAPGHARADAEAANTQRRSMQAVTRRVACPTSAMRDGDKREFLGARGSRFVIWPRARRWPRSRRGG